MPLPHTRARCSTGSNSVGLCGEGEIESAQVGGSGALEGCAGPPGVEPDEVDRGGGEGVFQADFAQAGVSGLADPGDRGDLVDGAFDPGAGSVGVLPGVGLLFGAGATLP
jgi:hypothetical protein